MSLRAAIDAVYDAFSDVEKPPFVDGCPCCMTADEYAMLTAMPLRALGAAELDEYARDVMLTMGTEDDYQYFLPRILELTIKDDSEWLSCVEIAANKLQMAGFQRWSEKKQTAINDLWLAVVREMATSEPDREMLGFVSSDIDSWIAAATLIPIPVSPLLNELEASPEVVRDLYNQNFTTLFQGRLSNAFLTEPSKGQTEITAWLRDRIERTMR